MEDDEVGESTDDDDDGADEDECKSTDGSTLMFSGEAATATVVAFERGEFKEDGMPIPIDKLVL